MVFEHGVNVKVAGGQARVLVRQTEENMDSYELCATVACQRS